MSTPARFSGSSFHRMVLFGFLLTLCTQAVRPMVSYRALELGASAIDLGIIASSFGVLAFMLAVPVGRLVDRWGGSRMMLGGIVLLTLTAVALVQVTEIWALAVSQAALGLGQIMSALSNQALIANAGEPSRRDARYGVFTVVISLGQLVGPAAAGIIAGGGASSAQGPDTRRVFIVVSVIATLAVLVALSMWWSGRQSRTRQPSGEPRAARPTSGVALREVAALPGMPQAMLASITVLTCVDVLTAYLPAFGEARGLSVQTVGFLLAARAAGSIVSRVLMLRLLTLLGRRRLLMVSMALPALALGTFPFLDALPLQYAAMVVTGLGLGLGQPVTLSWVAGTAPQELRGTALGLRMSGNRLGQVVLPMAVGAVAGAAGLLASFWALSVLLLLSSAVVRRTDFDGDAHREDPD